MMTENAGESLQRWLADLEQRHLADLRFAEVTRALRALSSTYVERRTTLSERSAFDSAGKRAAYALYYGPLHFLTVSRIVGELQSTLRPIHHLFDLGCGTGAAGAAWASAVSPPARVIAVDSHPWAVAEALHAYRAFGIDADVRRGDVSRAVIPRAADAVIAGWVLNEISDAARATLQSRLLEAAARGVQVLIVEPIATRVSPWWGAWAQAVNDAGGRADQWRFRVALPDLVRRLDRASGMRHDELTARSLTLARP